MSEAAAGAPVLRVEGLTTEFRVHGAWHAAIRGVSFDLARGETLAIVGESGCGKSMTALSLMRLIPDPPGRIVSGVVKLGGRDLLKISEEEMRRVRGNEISMIFQEPMTSLNPVMTIGKQIAEALILHRDMDRKAAFKRAIEMLDLVRIPEPAQRAKEYPHQLSGGMRQRAMIAMAIACKPDLLIADEPTTALDVTVQAQVLDVLIGIKDEIDSGIVLITHDLGVVAGLADQVMVMYAGRQVEMGTTEEIFYESRHPYTLGLLASLPRLDDTGDEPLVPIKGSPPSLIHRPTGCAFHPRCRFARVPGLCDTEVPALRLVTGDAHRAACHYAEELEGVSIESLRAAVDAQDLVVLDAETIDIQDAVEP